MSLDTPSITWRHLQGKVHAWTMSFGTKQSWSNSCMMFMLRMKKAMISRLGRSIVKIGHLTSKKCDIYATPTASTISRDLTPQCYFFFISRNRGGNGRNWLKCMNILHKQSTATFFKAVDGGRVVQFLAVFVHLACEAIFVNYFLRGRPKTPLIV